MSLNSSILLEISEGGIPLWKSLNSNIPLKLCEGGIPSWNSLNPLFSHRLPNPIPAASLLLFPSLLSLSFTSVFIFFSFPFFALFLSCHRSKSLGKALREGGRCQTWEQRDDTRAFRIFSIISGISYPPPLQLINFFFESIPQKFSFLALLGWNQL